MLLKALLLRMSGGTSGLSSKSALDNRDDQVHQKYPSLALLALDLLQESQKLVRQGLNGVISTDRSPFFELAYPALEILDRVGTPESLSASAAESLEDLLGNSVWHLREKAAKTLASLISKQQIVATIKRALNSSTSGQNKLHGSLLLVKYLLIHSSPFGKSRSWVRCCKLTLSSGLQ